MKASEECIVGVYGEKKKKKKEEVREREIEMI